MELNYIPENDISQDIFLFVQYHPIIFHYFIWYCVIFFTLGCGIWVSFMWLFKHALPLAFYSFMWSYRKSKMKQDGHECDWWKSMISLTWGCHNKTKSSQTFIFVADIFVIGVPWSHIISLEQKLKFTCLLSSKP